MPIVRRPTGYPSEFFGIEETEVEKESPSRRENYQSTVKEAPTLKDYR